MWQDYLVFGFPIGFVTSVAHSSLIVLLTPNTSSIHYPFLPIKKTSHICSTFILDCATNIPNQGCTGLSKEAQSRMNVLQQDQVFYWAEKGNEG